MKKLFLILVSVLFLGGCSVDDDTSVSGGGVSSGGDDMAITTYPNVVEASRTVVEGGYLVDYYANLGSVNEDVFCNSLYSFMEKIKEKMNLSNVGFVALLGKSNFSFVASSDYGNYDLYHFSIDACEYSGTLGFAFKDGVLLRYSDSFPNKFKFVFDSSSPFKEKGFYRFFNFSVTIFEPSK